MKMGDITYKKITTTPINLDNSIIIESDAILALQKLPSASVQCIVTSPPYWGLRDYGIKGQIGLEEKLQQYINKLVSVFAEAKRVLRDDGGNLSAADSRLGLPLLLAAVPSGVLSHRFL